MKSASTTAIEAMRRLEQFLTESKSRDVFVSLHPDVASYILAPDRNMLRPIGRRFGKSIHITENPHQHIEEIKIEESRV